jgi:hypothetical protein
MKKISIILGFILLIGLFGCGQGPSEQYVKDDYHTGTQGIEINFLNNAPPSRIYEGDNLDISIEVKNKGAYPEGRSFQGKIELSGFDPNSIRGSWDGGNSIPIDLEGKSQYNPEGGYEVMTYRDRNGVHVPFDADYYEPRIIVHSCYKYSTVADPVVCIDPDPYSVIEEDKVCNIHDVSLGGGQGAPIAVTRVEEEVGSDQIYFRIYVSNSGSGSVMLPRAYNDCPFDVELEDINKIVAKVKLPYDSSPDCSPKGTSSDPIRLTNGAGYIFCKFNKPASDSAYTTTLNVELDYTYSDSISKQIKIINIK